MKTARFVRSPGAALRIKAEVRPWLTAVAHTLADEIESAVQATNTGVLKNNYATGVSQTPGSVRIEIDSPFWHWIEYGTATTRGHHPIGRTMIQPGITFRDVR